MGCWKNSMAPIQLHVYCTNMRVWSIISSNSRQKVNLSTEKINLGQAEIFHRSQLVSFVRCPSASVCVPHWAGWCVHSEAWETEQVAAAVPNTPDEPTLRGDLHRWDPTLGNPLLGLLSAGIGPHQQGVLLVYWHLRAGCLNSPVYSGSPARVQGHWVPRWWRSKQTPVLLSYWSTTCWILQFLTHIFESSHRQHYSPLLCVRLNRYT